jgi:hypothetical protein
MPHASDSRSQYVSLALFSRQIIEALLELVRTGSRERLSNALPNAIESLEAATDSRSAGLYPAALRMATSYDQVRTIDELFPENERREMVQTLQSLSTESADPADQRSQAIKAMEFFYRIENRALRYCRQPSPRAPRASRRLCPTR